MYKYGMRLRGFSIGCQPMNGFIRRVDSIDDKYFDILVYDRLLTDKELVEYELDYLGDKKIIHFQIPLDIYGVPIIEPSLLIKFLSIIQKQVGENYSVISSPFKITNNSDIDENVSMKEIEFKEFCKNHNIR